MNTEELIQHLFPTEIDITQFNLEYCRLYTKCGLFVVSVFHYEGITQLSFNRSKYFDKSSKDPIKLKYDENVCVGKRQLIRLERAINYLKTISKYKTSFGCIVNFPNFGDDLHE